MLNLAGNYKILNIANSKVAWYNNMYRKMAIQTKCNNYILVFIKPPFRQLFGVFYGPSFDIQDRARLSTKPKARVNIDHPKISITAF